MTRSVDHRRGTTRPWKVLLVDDEPSVHDSSRLILKELTFADRRVELLHASSAGQALQLLTRHADVALMLLDVVMETDDAGLDLVQHVRDVLGNREIQIVLRTGQPGMAPEGTVVRQFAINGYFLKTEITAQRLQSIVISSLRCFDQLSSLREATGDPSSPGDSSAAAVKTPIVKDVIGHIQAEALSLQVQPELILASNRVCGAELVPHWRTPFGLLSASRMVERAPVDELHDERILWMFDQAIRWASSWHSSFGRPISVSVPMLGDCLNDESAMESILRSMRAARLPKGVLDILASERVLLSGDDRVADSLADLRAAGATITLADFGGQDISLPRLNQFAPDRLKIHRLYVCGVASSHERMAMARSLIALAHTMNIVTIADGIASDADAQFFKWEGCDIGQGNGIAPACAPADLSNGPARPAQQTAH